MTRLDRATATAVEDTDATPQGVCAHAMDLAVVGCGCSKLPMQHAVSFVACCVCGVCGAACLLRFAGAFDLFVACVLFVWGPGFRVQGSGFRVQGPGSRVQGSGLFCVCFAQVGPRVLCLGFRVLGLGLRFVLCFLHRFGPVAQARSFAHQEVVAVSMERLEDAYNAQ